ncbi:MAG: response regulator transcription factor [Deltaproteobacteria bacterium]
MPGEDETNARAAASGSEGGVGARAPRVLVVADDVLVRSGLAMLLARDVEVVGQVSSRDDVPGALRAERATVALWDLGADPRGVSERLGDLAQMPVPVLALVPGDASAVETIAAGAVGVMLRGVDAAMLGAALAAVSHGLFVLDPALSSLMPSRDRRAPPPTEDLTPREVEVLQQLAAGLPNKLIAVRLGISEHTVKFHVNAIMSKLGVESRTEAVVRAARLGLVIL